MQGCPPRVVFVGCVEISRVMLDFLHARGLRMHALITLPERLSARCSGYVDLSPQAAAHEAAVFRTATLHHPACLDFLRARDLDWMIVYGWQRIIKADAFLLPRHGAVGFHASLLPAYRGSAPVNWAIINGERETGVTMFLLDEGVDTGPIIAQRRFAIEECDDCRTVYAKSSQAACEMLAGVWPAMAAGRVITRENPSRDFPISPHRRPEDGLLDCSRPVRACHDWVRALTHPYPGAFLLLPQGKVFLWRAEPELLGPSPRILPGQWRLEAGRGVLLGCGDGALLVTSAQRQDGREARADLVFAALADANPR